MADSESDVSKALAAFGAPPLRYRSFLQSAARPTMPGADAPAEPRSAIRAEPFAPTRFVPELPDDPATRGWADMQNEAMAAPTPFLPPSPAAPMVAPQLASVAPASSGQDDGDMRLTDLFALLAAPAGGVSTVAP